MIKNSQCGTSTHIKIVIGYCTNCFQFVCNSCITKSHLNHKVIDVDEIENTFKNEHINRFNEMKREYDRIKELIKNHFHTLHDKLELKEIGIMNDIDEKYKTFELLYNNNINSLNELTNDLKSNQTDIKDKSIGSINLYTLNLPSSNDIKIRFERIKKDMTEILETADYFGEDIKFRLFSQNITLSNNSKTATLPQGKNKGHNLTVSEQSFKSGVHKLRVKIDRISLDGCRIFLGVTDKIATVNPNKEPTQYNNCIGISSGGSTLDPQYPTFGKLKQDWVGGDIFSLILNCDEGTLKILKERTGEIELRTNVKKNTTIHFAVDIYYPNISLTILN
ncbi:hypothetical protein DLAC_06536 [Tieghemostelium lacteum]|uniref:B box-type domain-containing protein n=1 Tax=Tieghemostelium lacteum TaxID=361077 RepID=A0A151ZF39_TIELA|nr:hypothetical protein DLAC_06536 [Tieghemostelium lacteum]|eukprot:KYQ92545.1 hypothetical protein DLAC_06536 [Tieghemostelium lacteum]